MARNSTVPQSALQAAYMQGYNAANHDVDARLEQAWDAGFLAGQDDAQAWFQAFYSTLPYDMRQDILSHIQLLMLEHEEHCSDPWCDADIHLSEPPF